MSIAVENQDPNSSFWWKDLLIEILPHDDSDRLEDVLSLSTISSLSTLHRRARKDFFNETLTSKTFFIISCLLWLDSCQWFDNLTLPALPTFWSKDSKNIVQWMIPAPVFDNLITNGFTKQAWMQFMIDYFHKCEEINLERPTKRIKLSSLTLFSASSASGAMKGNYQLPCAYLMIALLHQQTSPENWQTLHASVYNSLQYFKTFTKDDIQAALCLFGLDFLFSGTASLEGLTPTRLLKEYLQPAG
jgi:hypothetical protein